MDYSLMDLAFTSIAPVYPVDDVEAAVEWYERILGFRAIYVNRDADDDDPTNYAVLRRDGVTMHLIRRVEAEETFSRRADAQFTITGDIMAFFELLCSRGVNVMQPLRDQPWGCRDFVISDPSGNKVWISTP